MSGQKTSEIISFWEQHRRLWGVVLHAQQEQQPETDVYLTGVKPLCFEAGIQETMHCCEFKQLTKVALPHITFGIPQLNVRVLSDDFLGASLFLLTEKRVVTIINSRIGGTIANEVGTPWPVQH